MFSVLYATENYVLYSCFKHVLKLYLKTVLDQIQKETLLFLKKKMSSLTKDALFEEEYIIVN